MQPTTVLVSKSRHAWSLSFHGCIGLMGPSGVRHGKLKIHRKQTKVSSPNAPHFQGEPAVQLWEGTPLQTVSDHLKIQVLWRCISYWKWWMFHCHLKLREGSHLVSPTILHGTVDFFQLLHLVESENGRMPMQKSWVFGKCIYPTWGKGRSSSKAPFHGIC